MEVQRIPSKQYKQYNKQECSHVITKQFGGESLKPLKPLGIQELDDEIFKKTDFLTTVLAGASAYVIDSLYKEERFGLKPGYTIDDSAIIAFLRNFNDKCSHTDEEKKGKWLEYDMFGLFDGDEDECECGDGTCGDCYLQHCCGKNKDPRILSDSDKYAVLRYLSTQGVRPHGKDLKDAGDPFDKLLCEAFDICGCKYKELLSTHKIFAFARNNNVLRILSRQTGLQYAPPDTS